ncbi:hypothetical protein LINPERHAP1_LOCUS36350 [Linum perenne]
MGRRSQKVVHQWRERRRSGEKEGLVRENGKKVWWVAAVLEY